MCAWNAKKIDASDCAYTSQTYLDLIDELTAMIDIRKKVIEDFNTIREKFPCNSDARMILRSIVSNFSFFLVKIAKKIFYYV